MPSIESLGHPLAFKVSKQSFSPRPLAGDGGEIHIRLSARALDGMQKEALVHCGPNESVWRMVCDEGPYLNGTDLAPFPLAFYAAGMAFSFLSEVEHHALGRGIELGSARLEQDNYYTMEGSAIRGDMIGGSLPAELTLHIEADAPSEDVLALLSQAEASSPPQSYMLDVLQSAFSLVSNGTPIPVSGVSAYTDERAPDPRESFDAAQPDDPGEYQSGIIAKVAAAQAVRGVEGGAGSSLKSEQKRTLHVHTDAAVRADGLREAEIQLLKPIGSTFSFLSDEKALSAPPSLGYLSAGVAFCYMTQLGRYAKIVKQDLSSYRLVQDNQFRLSKDGERARAKPVMTQVFVELDDTEEAAQRLIYMGERTCFLHAAMRTNNPSELHAVLGGERIRVPVSV